MRIILIIIIIVTGSFHVQAQSAISLIDMSVMLLGPEEETPLSITILLSFKVDQPENTSQLVLKMGTAEELSDVKEITASITTDGENYFVNYDSQEYMIRGGEVSLIIDLTPVEFSNINVYTLYMIDDQEMETTHYYLNI